MGTTGRVEQDSTKPPPTMSMREALALEAAVARGERLTPSDHHRLSGEMSRIIDENKRLTAVMARGSLDQKREATELWKRNNEMFSRVSELLSRDNPRLYGPRPGTAPSPSAGAPPASAARGKPRPGMSRSAQWVSVLVALVVVAILAAIFSGGKSGGAPQPGESTGHDVSIRRCRIYNNPDGSVQARATVANAGESDEQANVVITLHFYGGATSDDNGLLVPGYSVPPGTHYISHNFTISSGQVPVSCTARFPY